MDDFDFPKRMSKNSYSAETAIAHGHHKAFTRNFLVTILLGVGFIVDLAWMFIYPTLYLVS